MSPSSIAATNISCVLPHMLPDDPDARLALFGIRRLGAHGLHDAHATHAFFTAFGEGFRRPLVLMRAFMADVAASATGPIPIAPCCCARMTGAEGALIDALARAETNSRGALLLLQDVLGTRGADGVLASAHALAGAFADAGRPITR